MSSSMAGLLASAETLSAKISGADAIPLVHKNHQSSAAPLHEASLSHIMQEDTGSIQSTQQKASLLFSRGDGVDFQDFKRQGDAILAHSATEHHHHHAKENQNGDNLLSGDLESFVQSQMQNAMTAVIEESRRRTTQKIRDNVDSAAKARWNKEKRWIVEQLGLASVSAGANSSSLEPTLHSVSKSYNDSMMLQAPLARSVMGIAGQMHQAVSNFVTNFESRTPHKLATDLEAAATAKISNSRRNTGVRIFWSLLTHLCSKRLLPNEASFSDVLKLRCVPTSPLFESIRAWLHAHHLNEIRDVVSTRLLEARLDNEHTGTLSLVRSYMTLTGEGLSHSDSINEWSLAFHSLTCGDFSAAVAVLRDAGHTSISEILQGVARPNALTELSHSFHTSVHKHSTDPYQKAVFSLILGSVNTVEEDDQVRKVLDRSLPTFLWFHLTQLHLMTTGGSAVEVGGGMSDESFAVPGTSVVSPSKFSVSNLAGNLRQHAAHVGQVQPSLVRLQKMVVSPDFFTTRRHARSLPDDFDRAFVRLGTGLFESAIESLIELPASLGGSTLSGAPIPGVSINSNVSMNTTSVMNSTLSSAASETRRLELPVHAVHAAIALHQVGVLFTPDSTDSLLFCKAPQDPDAVSRINFARLVSLYTKNFDVATETDTSARQSAILALQYLFLGSRPAFDEFFENCVTSLLLKSSPNEVDALIGRRDFATGRVTPGALQSYLPQSLFSWRTVLSGVAEKLATGQETLASVRCFDLADKTDACVEAMCRLLATLARPASPDVMYERQTVYKLCSGIAGYLRRSGTPTEGHHWSSLFLLLDLYRYFDLILESKWSSAVEILRTLAIFPRTSDEVDAKISNIALIFPNEISSLVLPDLLVSHMLCLDRLAAALKSSRNKSARGGNLSANMTYDMSNTSIVGGKLGVTLNNSSILSSNTTLNAVNSAEVAQLKEEAKTLMVFVCQLPYRLPSDVYLNLSTNQLLLEN